MAARQGMIRFTWKKPPTGMANATRELADVMDAVLQSGMTDVAGQVESYMKTNAPWKDRTRQARNSLSARANKTAKGNYTIIAKHGVPYGGYLETGTNYNPRTGRGNAAYPIIGPGLQAHYADVRRVMERAASFGGTGASV